MLRVGRSSNACKTSPSKATGAWLLTPLIVNYCHKNLNSFSNQLELCPYLVK